jgi:hypothetical protein
MPKIPTYERRGQLPVSYQQGLDSRERAAFTLGSQGTAETGKDIREAAGIGYKWYDQQQKEKAAIDIAVVTSDMGEKFSQMFEDLTREEERDLIKYKDMKLGGQPGSVPKGTLVHRVKVGLEKLEIDQAYLDLADQNKYFKNEFTKFTARFKEAAVARAIQQESQFHIQAVELGMQNGMEKAATFVSNDPTQLDGTMMLWRSILGDMDKDKIPDSMKGLTAVGVKPDAADKYLPIARPTVVQKAKENLNKIAEVAFLRMIADDPATAHKALKDLGSTPEGKWKLEKLYGFTGDQYLRLLNSSKTTSEFVNYVEKSKLDRSVKDAAVSAFSTGASLPGFNSREEIEAKYLAILDPSNPNKSKQQAWVMADEAWREIEIGKKAYGITAGFSSMSTQQINQTVKNLKPAGVNAADEQRIQQLVLEKANLVITQRQQDSAAYYKNTDVVQRKLKQGDRAGANDLIIAAQLRDNRPPHELELLTKAEIEEEKSFLTGAKGEVLGQRLRSFIDRYAGKDGKRRGDLQIAWRQLTSGPNPLPPEYIWAANAMGTSAERAIIDSLSIEPEVIKKSFGTLQSQGVSYALIENTAESVGQQYQRALTGGVTDRLSTFQSAQALAIRIAATKLANTGSTNVKQEVQNAFKLVTQGYDLQGGTYYIQTKSVGGGNTPLNPAVIHSNAQRLRTSKDLLQKYASVQAPGSANAGNQNPAVREKEYLEMLEQRGYWINNDNGTGLQLVIDVSGVVEPVMTKNGNRYEYTWTQLNNPNLLPKEKSLAERIFGR